MRAVREPFFRIGKQVEKHLLSLGFLMGLIEANGLTHLHLPRLLVALLEPVPTCATKAH